MLSKIYYNKWFPRLFYTKNDGGEKSGVKGYFLIEWKKFFSIGLLHFDKGSRESYHSHAFNAVTWWLSGKVTEETIKYSCKTKQPVIQSRKDFKPSFWPKFTRRSTFHKVIAHKPTWAISFRGCWQDKWLECRPVDGQVTLTHGRKIVE